MDLLALASTYTRYSMNTRQTTGSGLKNRLSVPSLRWKHLNYTRTEEDEPIFSYSDKYKRRFVRQSFEGGEVAAFNQYYLSEISDKLFNTLSEESNLKEIQYKI